MKNMVYKLIKNNIFTKSMVNVIEERMSIIYPGNKEKVVDVTLKEILKIIIINIKKNGKANMNKLIKIRYKRIYFLNKYSSFLIGNVIIMNIFIMVFFNVVIIFTFIFMKYLLIVDKYKTLPNNRARNM